MWAVVFYVGCCNRILADVWFVGCCRLFCLFYVFRVMYGVCAVVGYMSRFIVCGMLYGVLDLVWY